MKIFRLAAHNNVAKNTASTRPEQSAIIIGKKTGLEYYAITIHYMSGFFSVSVIICFAASFLYICSIYFANIESSRI